MIGSAGGTSYKIVDGTPVLVKEGGVALVDGKAGKPVGIDSKIGKRPIFAAGDSDGDFQMLEWTTSGDGTPFGLLIHHTDAAREFAYDCDSDGGVLDRALDEAETHATVPGVIRHRLGPTFEA